MKITRATKNYFPQFTHPHLKYMALSYRQALRDILNAMRNIPELDVDYIDGVLMELGETDALELLKGSFVKKHQDVFMGL